MTNSIYDSELLDKGLTEIKLIGVFSERERQHIQSILIAALSAGYKGKMVNIAQYSQHHRTTISRFLSHGKWADDAVEATIRHEVVHRIWEESRRTGKPIFCIVDDTVSEKTKPSSQACHPIEEASYHYSHLDKKTVYGHQMVSVMLSCNNLTLNYTLTLYDKKMSKIDIVRQIAKQFPVAPVKSYMLCDCWYTSTSIMDDFLAKGFYTIAGIKVNRVIYPLGIKQQVKEFAQYIQEDDVNVDLVTVSDQQYYVYRYEGKLNGVENAVVLITYPKAAFGEAKALRAFICTDVSLSTQDILQTYVHRWPIEVFFRQTKGKLALNKYQIRSITGIRRFWLLMSLTHLLCCVGTGVNLHFEDGYSYFQTGLMKERVTYIYQCGVCHYPLVDLLDQIV